MASPEDADSKMQTGVFWFIVHRPFTVVNTMFTIALVCWIPGLKLPEKQSVISMPSFDMHLVGDFSDEAVYGSPSYYALWCKTCNITTHPEYYEDRARALRVLQKVKKKEHKCRDMTWTTHEDRKQGEELSEYVDPTGTVSLVKLMLGNDPDRCLNKVTEYLRGLKGQMSGEVKSGLAGTRPIMQGSYAHLDSDLAKHQIILLPILVILMWSVCGGWWRSLTNCIISTWACGCSNAFVLLLSKIQGPGLEMGFNSGTVPFICLAFCTDYSIFFWTRFQKEREENPAKEKYLQCIVTTMQQTSEVIICSTFVMIAAYCSTSLFPHMNDLGWMAMNFQLAFALLMCGTFSLTVLPSWAAAFPSLFENREPNSPNPLQKCLPAMMTNDEGGRQFWKAWTGFVTRGKMMIIVPMLAYGILAPFVVCLCKYEPNYDLLAMQMIEETPETDSTKKLTSHFGAGEMNKWIYVLRAGEIGAVKDAAMLQLDDLNSAPTSEEVAFAQHALKMSRKANGIPLHESIVATPEFGKEVCKFAEQLIATIKENHIQIDESKVDTIWYGKDPFGGKQHGCRSSDQIADGLQKEGVSFDDKFGKYIHRYGARLLMNFYPSVEYSSDTAQGLYHVLRQDLEERISHEFTIDGKRYWFETEHTSAISYLKETGVDMRKAAPFVMGLLAVLAFTAVATMFRAIFLPFKFVLTIVIPILAVLGFMVSVFQENWWEFVGSKHMSAYGGIHVMIPYAYMGLLCGLAMDYDIFLFARVYEYRHEGYDNVSSVQKSLVETGSIVMTAGTFMAVSFFFTMLGGIHTVTQVGFLYFAGVLVDTYFTCTCIAPCVLCWGEWMNFFPGYIPPVTKTYNVELGCDEEPK
jgi:predicted RND superfamily exporter protein